MRKVYMHTVDSWGDCVRAGLFKELGGERVLYENHDYGLSRCTQVRVVAPKDFTPEEVENAIRAHYHYRCNHEHDCCGCVMVSAFEVKPAGKKNEYFFTVDETQNV